MITIDSEDLGAWLNALCDRTLLDLNEVIALCQLAGYASERGYTIETMLARGAENIALYQKILEAVQELNELGQGLDDDHYLG